MLVPSMNFNELDIEANAEYDALCNSSTLGRLTYEYFGERIKLKIKPHEKYVKFYKIKSKKKNNWLLMFSPNDKCQLVKSPEDITAMCILYYHSDKGLRFVLTSPSKIIIVYNEHLFSRYKERIGLVFSDTIEIAKHFFLENDQNTFQSFPNEDKSAINIIGVLKNGFGLGELVMIENKRAVLLYKTFIARGTAGFKHAKSLFELEKIYRNKEDEESRLLYETLGFDETKSDNNQFLTQWESLRKRVLENEEQSVLYQVVSEKDKNYN
jgi:hypothetical protein